MQPHVVGGPVPKVIIQNGICAECRHERVGDQILADERVVSLVPWMQREIGARVRANQQGSDRDCERGSMKAVTSREAARGPEERRNREHHGECPRWEP